MSRSRFTGFLLTNWPALNLIGLSPSFQRTLHLLERWAQVDATVLLVGETGTGKELAAHAIHYLSPRGQGPFVPVNCAALPDSLLEAELFGHAKGAFTDARVDRPGLISQADGGTLFLDEIDSLSPRAQAAILRFMQDHCYRPLGGTRQEQPSVRVIAATNADLAALVACGQFRQDLLYRINLLSLVLPPLRERAGDALLLAEAFVQRLARQYGAGARLLSADSRQLLALPLPWPGNVRELEHCVHRGFLLAQGESIELDLQDRCSGAAAEVAPSQRVLPLPAIEREGSALAAAPPPPSYDCARAEVLCEFERRYLIDMLRRSGGNLTLAARWAGKERSHFGKLVRKHGLQRAADGR
jgi:transcriptional regulator with GAF, ATPase, and Fis domain